MERAVKLDQKEIDFQCKNEKSRCGRAYGCKLSECECNVSREIGRTVENIGGERQ